MMLPRKCGPSTAHFLRFASERSTQRPLRVPTSTATPPFGAAVFLEDIFLGADLVRTVGLVFWLAFGIGSRAPSRGRRQGAAVLNGGRAFEERALSRKPYTAVIVSRAGALGNPQPRRRLPPRESVMVPSPP